MPRMTWPAWVAIGLAGCAAAPPAPTASTMTGRFRTVHVDTIAPDLVGQFESARTAWLAALAARQTSDARGVFLQVDGHTFLTLRPFTAFADLDKRGPARAQALSSVDPALRKRYDDQSDMALVFPHRNEIWSVEEKLGFQAPGGPASECRAGAGRLVVESVRPAPPFESQYQAAWTEATEALARERYPLTRVTYSSYFGEGRLYSLWLAKSREELAGASSVEATLAHALGSSKAADLMRRIAECVIASESFEIVPRPDLSNPEFCR